MKTHVINYVCNKFFPWIILLFALFWNSGVNPLNAVLVLGCCFFIDKFSFKTGYSVAYCEANNINLDVDD
tara:strand:+ start:1966 stop:2175 length:210 start_codon:yes stop_codon:yes gene_type:complete